MNPCLKCAVLSTELSNHSSQGFLFHSLSISPIFP